MLRLHDTATGAVSPLAMREPGVVSMYVCGPTVYDHPHLGHGRSALAFDVLRRFLEFTGIEVRHVSNITDIDDKIIERAGAEGCTIGEVTARYEASYWDALETLGILRPTHAPRATEYVEQMVAAIATLVEGGHAYGTSDGVYLATDTVPDYGLLGHQDLEALRVGERVESNAEKRSPLDFVLWKKAKPGEPQWPSPWGPGRPGWHTECVVMSLDLLGEGFDLHGGGNDLVFPHHENERAQAVALGRPFARHWTHHGFVMVDDEKMSKSLGNFTTLDDLRRRADPRAYRLLVLRAHYRSPIEVTAASVSDAAEALARLSGVARRFALDPSLASVPVSGAVATGADADALASFVARMDDDLDTPGAVSGLFELVRRANTLADAGDDASARPLAVSVAVLAGALGLSIGASASVDDQSAAMVAERDEARAARDWARADDLRRRLEAAGWVVEDTAAGTRLHR